MMILPVMFVIAITHHGYYVSYEIIGICMALLLSVMTTLGFGIMYGTLRRQTAVVPVS